MVNSVNSPDTRTRILQIARDLYIDGGPEALSMRRVAARVGLSATAIYRHFASKRGLIIAVIKEGFRIFSGYLARSLDTTDPAARIEACGDGYLDFAVTHPADYRAMFMVGVPEGEHTAPPYNDCDEIGENTFRFIVERVGEAITAGILLPADPEKIALALWAHAHGLISLFLNGQLGTDADAFRGIYRDSFGFLLRGLGKGTI
jgi:AcrR family transcriptional regulator